MSDSWPVSAKDRFTEGACYYRLDWQVINGINASVIDTWIYCGFTSGDGCGERAPCGPAAFTFQRLRRHGSSANDGASEFYAYTDGNLAQEQMRGWNEFVDACIAGDHPWWVDRSDPPIWKLPICGTARASINCRAVSDEDEYLASVIPECAWAEIWSPITRPMVQRLKELPSLRSVTVRESAMADDASIAMLGELTNIEALSVRGKAASDRGIGALAGLCCLYDADFRDTGVTDHGVQLLSRHKTIRNLALDQTRITDDAFRWIVTMPNLEAISVENTDTGDRGARSLQEAKGLVVINLSRTAASDEALAAICRLDKLWALLLSCTKVSDVGLRHLEATKSLRELWLRRASISHRALRCFCEAVPECRVFR